MEFRVLGPVEAIDDSGRLALGGPQQRRLLAVLLSDPGRALTYDRLLEVLWPDGDPPDNARRTAISYLSRLRAALGEGWVSTKDAGYRVNVAGASIDADRFTTLVEAARSQPPARAVDVLDEALGLWRGPVFGELCDEWWARPMVARLEELRLTALADRIDALVAAGWESRSLVECQTVVAAHPLRPQLVERLMRVLHAQGRTDEALRAFQAHRDEMVERTGLDPSTELVALERSIASGAAATNETGSGRSRRGYVLQEALGEGSFGTVYRAAQPTLGRDVAIKVIRAELADDRTFIHRFEAEAQLVARLEHPSVVPLYDFWREPGGAYLVFRLLRGGSADRALVADGPFPLDRVTGIVEQIGGALAAAHAAGIVHRDVKPANILFDDAGQAYLSDFGIATSERSVDEPHAVATRSSAGSPMYASPEQVRDGTADGRADQYALAATVWELLTGQPPFPGGSASAVMAAKLRGPLPSLRTAGPALAGLPVRLDDVLGRASAVHPDDRFDDMTAFVLAWKAAAVSREVLDTAQKGLEADMTTVAAATTPLLAGLIANPYKGLRPFREADAAEFFGRTLLAEQLDAVVKEHGFAAVVGPSGSGKSSLVLAGLVPRLKRRGALVVSLTPGADPFVALATALSELATVDSSVGLTPDALRRAGGAEAAMRSVAAGEELVIVVDQLEELWTATEHDDRERFARVLAELGQHAGLRVVVTIRADWFDRPLRDASLGPLVARATFGVTSLSATELREAITGPAALVGVRFEPGLVGRIVAESLDQPGSLPLLQFALTDLFDQRDGATITSAGYDEMGGLAGSVAHQAEAIYDGFSPPDQAAVRRLFARLVTAGEGSEDTRRRVPRAELAGIPDEVVAAFVGRRLLTVDRDRDSREPTVEVAHEALLRSWPRLREWLDADREWLRALRGLAGATTLWQSSGRDDADLYRGARLAVVSELAADRADALTPDEASFLAASEMRATAELEAAETRARSRERQNKRLRRSLVGLAAVVVMALLAGGLALSQRARADHQASVAASQAALAAARAEEAGAQRSAAEVATKTATDAQHATAVENLVNSSIVLRSSSQDLAALLAVEAYRLDPTAKTRSGLFSTFTRNSGFLGYRRVDGTESFGAVLPLGTGSAAIAALSNGRLARLDLDTGKLGALWPAMAEGPGVETKEAVLSGDQKVVVDEIYGGASERWSAYDTASGRPASAVFDLPSNVQSTSLNRDGSLVAFGGAHPGKVFVYRTADAHLVGTYQANPADRWASVHFGPDDRLFVGADNGTISVLDPTTMAVTASHRGVDGGASWGILSAPDRSYLISYGSDRVTRIDLPSGTVRWSFQSQNALTADKNVNEAPCALVELAAALGRFYCSDFFGSLTEYDASTGGRTQGLFDTQLGDTVSLAVTSDGSQLIAASGNTNAVARWRLDGSGPIQRTVAPGNPYAVNGYDASGRYLIVGKPSGAPAPLDLDWAVWDLATDRLADPMDVTPFATWAATPGQLLGGFFAGGSARGGIYDVASGKRVPGVDVPLDLSQGIPVVFLDAARHRTFLSVPGGTVRTFANTGAETGPTIHVAGGGTASVSWTTDGTTLVISTIDDGTALYDATTGKPLGPSLPKLWNATVSSANVGVGSSFDGTLSTFDPTTMAVTGKLNGSRGAAQQLDFSADGALLLVRGGDRRLSLHDVAARVQLGDPLPEDPAAFASASLRPDGKELAIPNGRTGITLWDLDPAHWVDAACALAGRNLTQREWDTYLGQFGPYHATCSTFAAGGPG